MSVPRKLQTMSLCLLLCVICFGVGCSPRDFLTRRLAMDLISSADAFKVPQLFWLRSGVVSNKDFSSPEMMVLKRRGWIIGNEQKHCPLGVEPPPCWDVILTPLGIDTIRPSISRALPDAGSIAIQAAHRELVSIENIGKADSVAEVAFIWHWVPFNQVGAALYDSGVHYRSTVEFRKYEGGWRIAEQPGHVNQPLDAALQNAQPVAP